MERYVDQMIRENNLEELKYLFASQIYDIQHIIDTISYFFNDDINLSRDIWSFLKIDEIDIEKNCFLKTAIKSQNDEILKFLVQIPGIDLNITDDDLYDHTIPITQSFPLLVAIDNEYEYGIKCLLEHKADVHWENDCGLSAPLYAVSFSNTKWLQLLLRHGNLDINYIYKYQHRTILFQSVLRESIKSVEFLLNLPEIDINIPSGRHEYEPWSLNDGFSEDGATPKEFALCPTGNSCNRPWADYGPIIKLFEKYEEKQRARDLNFCNCQIL